MATVVQGLKLDVEVSERLKILAAKRDRTPHWIMKKAVCDYLEREEYYEREKAEDAARWEKYLLTGRAIDGAEMETWLQNLSQGKTTKCPK